MDIITSRMVRQAVPLFNVFAAVMLVLGIAAILIFGKDVIVHIALAILLSFALSPIVNRIEALGLGRGIAVTGAVLLALGLIGSISYVAYGQAQRFAAEIPSYEPTIRAKISGLSTEMQRSGAFSAAADTLARVVADLQKIGDDAETPAAAIPTVKIDNEAHGFAALMHYVEPLLHPLATLFVVMLLSAFMLADREDLRNRFIRLVGTDDIQQTTAAIDDAGRRVGRLLLTQVAVNLCFGLVISLGLWIIGVPSPFLWGIMAGILRFVPYIGAIIGLIPPLFVAFAIDPTWWSLIYTVILFAVIEPLVGHVIEPLLYGHSSGLSPVAIIIAATVWAFLWGPIGLVLATPLTICLVVLGRYTPRLQFLDVLLGDRPALEPHEIFYQRMLAGDPQEAVRQAHLFLKERTLATYYDQIALAAIRRAHLDTVRGTVAGDRLAALVKSAGTLVDSLATVKRPSKPARARSSAEAEAALASVKANRQLPTFYETGQLPDPWRSPTPVAVLYGNDPLDVIAARMLAQSFTRQGLNAQAEALTAAENATSEQRKGTALVVLSFVEPLSRIHLRAYLRRVHLAVPQAQVMLCIWRETDPAIIDDLRRRVHVKWLTTTITDALGAVHAMITRAKGRAPATVSEGT